jgi:2-polyprenyl-3-methyl-5-hydroxy-6-metoxy-1,4-benzoquinol methylase
MSEPNYLQEARDLWDRWADRFDDEADHGLRAADVRAAWSTLLNELLPNASASILDVGCGTGSISVLAAELGHVVHGIDCSPEMIRSARDKASAQGLPIRFEVGDAANPQVGSRKYDVILCRHVLWTLPEIPEVLRRWAELLTEGGRLILIEGFWNGTGSHAGDLLHMIPAQYSVVETNDLSLNSMLWGKQVSDERYVVKAVL